MLWQLTNAGSEGGEDEHPAAVDAHVGTAQAVRTRTVAVSCRQAEKA